MPSNLCHWLSVGESHSPEPITVLEGSPVTAVAASDSAARVALGAVAAGAVDMRNPSLWPCCSAPGSARCLPDAHPVSGAPAHHPSDGQATPTTFRSDRPSPPARLPWRPSHRPRPRRQPQQQCNLGARYRNDAEMRRQRRRARRRRGPHPADAAGTAPRSWRPCPAEVREGRRWTTARAAPRRGCAQSAAAETRRGGAASG